MEKQNKQITYYDIFELNKMKFLLIGNEKGLQNLHIYSKTGKREEIKIQKDWKSNSEFFKEIKTQLNEYFNQKRKKFNIKLNPKGTQFQKTIWNQLLKIPHGELSTYKQIATKIGNDKASRAIGMANNKNPIPIIIPCHRVIGTNQKLTGFAFGLDIKEKLIKIENKLK